MEEYQLAIFVTTFLIFLIFLGFFIWGIRSGQFTDIEIPKFRMLGEYEVPENENDTGED